jgi:GDP/UDP-N,N'-diacetylbacillosamine 2-epimerase (hydrolysing)
MIKKICIVTGCRADYGLLKHLMSSINQDSEFDLQIIVTGNHLSTDFGLTYQEIEEDGFNINKKVSAMDSADTRAGISRSIGLGVAGVSEALEELSPDLMIVLGDRFEILAACIAGLMAGIPIAHIHGGETTLGAFDESIRHAITKMSNLHFVAAEEYRKRIIQLGENPEHVFTVGGLGVDAMLHIKLLSREELEKQLGLSFSKKNLLITYHPVTLDINQASAQLKELLASVRNLEDTTLIFTFPNADPESRVIVNLLEDFAAFRANTFVYTSLGQKKYLSCINEVDGVLGNSSSGLLEVPSFKKGTINIGDRQYGRLSAESVINCGARQAEIENAIVKLYSPNFQLKLGSVKNPYGYGGAVEKIIYHLKALAFPINIKKPFFDLVF